MHRDELSELSVSIPVNMLCVTTWEETENPDCICPSHLHKLY